MVDSHYPFSMEQRPGDLIQYLLQQLPRLRVGPVSVAQLAMSDNALLVDEESGQYTWQFSAF